MLLTGPFAMLSMPSFDFYLPPCTEGFLIHLSPLWQLPRWQLPLFPSVAQFPCVGRDYLAKSYQFAECGLNMQDETEEVHCGNIYFFYLSVILNCYVFWHSCLPFVCFFYRGSVWFDPINPMSQKCLPRNVKMLCLQCTMVYAWKWRELDSYFHGLCKTCLKWFKHTFNRVTVTWKSHGKWFLFPGLE